MTQWIKCSDRLPGKAKMYICKVTLVEDGITYKPVTYIRYDLEDKSWFNPMICGKSCVVYEWLEETEEPLPTTGIDGQDWDSIFEKYSSENNLNLEEVRYFFIPFLNYLKKNYPKHKPQEQKSEQDDKIKKAIEQLDFKISKMNGDEIGYAKEEWLKIKQYIQSL